jgi:hypothetical protein
MDLPYDGVDNPLAIPNFLWHIRNMQREFALSDGRVQHRLLTALPHLVQALELREGWPEGLYNSGQQLAQDLRTNREWLKRGGGASTRRLFETLGQRLLDLAVDAEASVRWASKCWEVVDKLREQSECPNVVSDHLGCLVATESTSC